MNDTENGRAAGAHWTSWVVLLVLMGVALALRWRYVQEISLAVDEFNTIWAARHVLVRGLPSFPSGNLYPHGFVFTYLVTPTVLGAFSETLARVPGVLVSLAALPAAFWAGRRMFDDRVGLFVAAVLAVDPDAVLWGGRARMYGLLQLLTIMAIYLYYRGLAQDRARDRYLAAVVAVVAIFTHAEAALLLPALGLATLVAWPTAKVLRREVILPFVLAGVGAAAYFLMSKLGQPGHLETLQETRPYLDLTADVLSGPEVFAPVFFDLHRLPFTLLALAGLYFLFRPRFERRGPLLYLYVVFAALLIPLLVLSGATWRSERYLFLLLPLLYLIAGVALCRLLDLAAGRRWGAVLRRARLWQPVVLALLAGLYVGASGTAQAYEPELGYDRALRHLQDLYQPEAGDVVVTVAPSACAVYLGEGCDYFAIQHGYEEFVVELPERGVVDLWTATPVITETAAFVDLLAAAPRVWFVTDSWRFQTRYNADFIQVVLDHMELVYDERAVQIYRTEGYVPLPEPDYRRERQAAFGRALALTGFGLSPAALEPGGELEVTLYWQALEEAGVGYTAFLHLLAADDASRIGGVAGVDGPVLDGRYQPDFWPQEMTFADRHALSLPVDLPPGRYRLDLGLYPTGEPEALLPVEGPGTLSTGTGDRLPLVMLTVGPGDSPPATMIPVYLDFGQQIRLVGYELDRQAQPGTMHLQLYWQALAPVDRDYTVFAHLLGPDGQIAAQADSPPGDPTFPTTTWLPGDTVADARTLSLPPDAPPGDYTIAIGLYFQPTDVRLEATDAHGRPQGDGFRLGPFVIGGEAP